MVALLCWCCVFVVLIGVDFSCFFGRWLGCYCNLFERLVCCCRLVGVLLFWFVGVFDCFWFWSFVLGLFGLILNWLLVDWLMWFGWATHRFWLMLVIYICELVILIVTLYMFTLLVVCFANLFAICWILWLLFLCLRWVLMRYCFNSVVDTMYIGVVWFGFTVLYVTCVRLIVLVNLC